MHNFESGPSPADMGVETAEQQIKKIDDILDRMSDEEIDSGTYSGNIEYHIKIARTQKDVVINNEKALFEVPVNLFLQNEDQYEHQDTMFISCEINLSDGSVQITGKLDDKSNTYDGELDEWYEDATQFIKSHFAGKPKSREDLEMDQYLRG